MNYDKLTETLRQHGVSCVRAHGRYCSICDEAATALSTIQAENEKLRAELERCKEKNAGLALALLTECAPNPDCLGDDEWRAIRAELEKVTRERDAAVERLREWEKFDIYLLAHNFLIPEKWRGQKED